MALATGFRIGPYEILAPLGVGGMGEVYRARDSKLGREVAIKVLPEDVSADPTRLMRFEREARVLASLNHPNIAAIYGVEDSTPVKALVLELVEGPTLEDRNESGEIPLEEALSIAVQIADALEAAHEKGIVHRDLKPANVKLGPEDRVKVLDFGLAKALDPLASNSSSSPNHTHSPTLSIEGTKEGFIVGTAPYMSPEQARGKSTDRRADIWAFGVLLWEMLTGRRLFVGETVSDIVAAVLRQEISFDDLPAATPAAVRSLLQRCLDRDAKTRLRDIGEARIGIQSALAGRSAAGSGQFHSIIEERPRPKTFRSAGAKSRTFERRVWVAAVAVALALPAIFLWKSLAREGALRAAGLRLEFEFPKGERAAIGTFTPSFAISPDGSKLVYTVVSGATTRLRLHSMDREDSAEIPGTDGVSYPFFSPDGRWIGFFDSSGLRKVAVAGGAPLMIAPKATVFGGAVWSDDGWIYFAPQVNTPVSRVSAKGGDVRAVTRFQPGDQNHRWPEALPGGKAILFTVGSGTEWDGAKIVSQRLDTGERKVLIDGGTCPRYVPGGYIVYARGNAINAVSFDARRLEVTSSPAEVARNVWLDPTGLSHFDFSRTGVLASISSETAGAKLALSWIERDGRSQPLAIAPLDNFLGGVPSFDGRALLRLGNSIAVLDLDRLSMRKLTLSGRAAWAIWSADATNVIFGMERDRSYRIFSKSADDSGTERLLFPSDSVEYPAAVFPGGAKVLVFRAYPNGENALAVRAMDSRRGEDRSETVLVRSRFVSADTPVSPIAEAAISPDGRWVAYVSTESGRSEVLVRPSSGADRTWQVSVNGGSGPLWSPSGNEIVFGTGTAIMSVPVHADGDFSSGIPTRLFDRPEVRLAAFSADGKRFFGAVDPNYRTESKIDVTTGWFAKIRKKIQESRAP